MPNSNEPSSSLHSVSVASAKMMVLVSSSAANVKALLSAGPLSSWSVCPASVISVTPEFHSSIQSSPSQRSVEPLSATATSWSPIVGGAATQFAPQHLRTAQPNAQRWGGSAPATAISDWPTGIAGGNSVSAEARDKGPRSRGWVPWENVRSRSLLISNLRGSTLRCSDVRRTCFGPITRRVLAGTTSTACCESRSTSDE